jgi:hypothetical protein
MTSHARGRRQTMGTSERFITIPVDVVIAPPGDAPEGTKPTTLRFTSILRDFWLRDPRFAGSHENGMHGVRLQEAFESSPWVWKEPGEVARVYEPDFVLLREAMLNPTERSQLLDPLPWRYMKRAGWFEAVSDAPTTPRSTEEHG